WCGRALDRLVDLCARAPAAAAPATFAREREAIRRAIERDGVSERLGCYVSVFGSEGVDASLLLLSVMGYADPRSERMRRTVARVRERLEVNGVVYRYRDDDDGLEGGEAAFGICSFWAVEARALQGDEGAREQFERLLRHANDVGLYAEEIDAASGAAIGNFPQAFTHVGLINAAVALSRSECQATSLRTTASPDGRNTS
ncbi:MAG: glycoside hydrolase family 15 protein, partial [Vicinamibacterales bacterium]